MIWIITREINQYDQEGEYFVAAFTTKPTPAEVRHVTSANRSDDFIAHILRGGGRCGGEGEWYWLREVRHGEVRRD